MSGGHPFSIREMTRATRGGRDAGRARVYDERDRDDDALRLGCS